MLSEKISQSQLQSELGRKRIFATEPEANSFPDTYIIIHQQRQGLRRLEVRHVQYWITEICSKRNNWKKLSGGREIHTCLQPTLQPPAPAGRVAFATLAPPLAWRHLQPLPLQPCLSAKCTHGAWQIPLALCASGPPENQIAVTDGQ